MSEFEDKLNSLLSDPAGMAQVVQLAQQLSGSLGGSEGTSSPPPPSPSSPPPPPPQGGPGPGGGLGGLDPKVIARFLPLLQAYSRDQSNTMQLLMALRPYLKEEKQGKIQRAAKLARLICVGKQFFKHWEGGIGV